MAVKVERIYRRQWADSPTAFVRDVCAEVGYHGRYLWLVETGVVHVIGPSSGRNSHIRYRLVDLDGPRVVPLKGRGLGKIHFTKGSNTVVVAVPVLHGRKRTGFLFVRPTMKYNWSKAATNHYLMPEEVVVLKRKTDVSDHATYEVARACCLHRGLIHPYGDLTPDGLELLRWHDLMKSRNQS
jgi:hypothetical protein